MALEFKIAERNPRFSIADYPNYPPLPVFEKTQFGVHRASHGSAEACARNPTVARESWVTTRQKGALDALGCRDLLSLGQYPGYGCVGFEQANALLTLSQLRQNSISPLEAALRYDGGNAAMW